MSATPRVAALAPFRVRSFSFQWPADLATSWAFEMETIILGWYVLIETQSVFMLTVFASLLYVGTLLSPMFGVMGDRIGQCNVLCAMRCVYAACALTLMTFAFLGALTPGVVLAVATVFGLVRPSDIGVRAALVGETMPGGLLMGAMSIQRTTLDSARIAGALSGAGLVATLGIGPAYTVVVTLYAISAVLTLKAGSATPPQRVIKTSRLSPWRDLKEGLTYVWNTPHLFAMMCLALLVNLTAFPIYNSLLPVVAKEVYHTDQTGLGYMVAGAATGALIGSIVLSRIGHAIRAGRLMIVCCMAWYSTLLAFAHTQQPMSGIPVLLLAGAAQSLSMVSMAAALLRHSGAEFHGRIMGIRMLVIYGNLPGILGAGPLIANFGYPATATLYAVIGLVFTLLIALRWRAQLWWRGAPVNAR